MLPTDGMDGQNRVYVHKDIRTNGEHESQNIISDMRKKFLYVKLQNFGM